MSKYYLYLLVVLFMSCKTKYSEEKVIVKQPELHKDLSVEEAKWYFYSYSSSLEAHVRYGENVNPLACELLLKSIDQVNQDTTRMYFNAYYKDTLNICNFFPYGLVGITIVRKKLYLPIYHVVVFDAFESDSITMTYMKEQEKNLYIKVEEHPQDISQWLKNRLKK